MLGTIKRLLARKEAQADPPTALPVAYSIERDDRVTSVLGSEGLKFSHYLEAARRIDPIKFYEALYIIARTITDGNNENMDGSTAGAFLNCSISRQSSSPVLEAPWFLTSVWASTFAFIRPYFQTFAFIRWNIRTAMAQAG